MTWIQLKINTTDKKAENISEYLMTLGACSITFQDSNDIPIFEPLPGETPLWGDTDIIALFDAKADTNNIIQQLKCSPLFGASFSYKWEQVEDKDWEREWMKNFHPLKFGQRLWICPSWLPVVDEHAVNVILDPGLAFGTGTHPTTALCLEWLDSLDLTNKTVIDFGCGSGILAIAALKLGAKHAIGIDIDPQAILASKENARRNDVNKRLTLYLANQHPTNITADVVIANILAGPLKELSPTITALVKENGKLGLSGILSTLAKDVMQCYQPAFVLDPLTTREEWCRITGNRKHLID